MRSLQHRFFNFILETCSPAACSRLPASCPLFFLDVARYACKKTTANLLGQPTTISSGSNDRILCFLPNKILFLTLLLTVAFQEFRLFSIHSFFYYIYLLTRSYAGLYISCDTANAVMRCMSLFFTLFSATP